ncbi:Flp pilus assembly protein CpaB [Brucella gallinifaecis]|uniref:Flp pilus assembly protein CpaB n=1 Tax=Brucella gallinifaecis TaxID=215590 RepID=UPI00130E8BFD|nr:Flp pilus assembly protein CpaB [Brucella gallinifaecis]
MRLRRITLFVFAAIAAVVTLLIGTFEVLKGSNQTVEYHEAKPRPVEVLVVDRSLQPGDKLEGALSWQTRSSDIVQPGAVMREAEPEAIEGLAQLRLKTAVMPGHILNVSDYIPLEKRALSLKIKPHMRAMAVNVAVDTVAGGFILPDDKVDVVITRTRPGANGNADINLGRLPSMITETVLRDVRVLAIDQVAASSDAEEPVILGKTATLELTPAQVEIMVAAQAMASKVDLSLRSAIVENDEVPLESEKDAEHLVFAPGPKGNVHLITSSNITEVGVRR